MIDWQQDAELAWWLLSWEGEAQWFGKGSRGVMGGRLLSCDGLMRAIRAAEEHKFDFYLGANPTTRCGTKAASRHVTHWRYGIVDIDPINDMARPVFGDEVRFRLLSRRLEELVITSTLPPHHRISSGRGIQLWIPLDLQTLVLQFQRSPTVQEHQADAIESALGGWLRHLATHLNTPEWRVDTTCSDLARVVRCPGSINWKTGRRASVESITCSTVPPAAILAHMPPAVGTVTPLLGAETLNLRDILPHLKVANKRFVLEGQEEPGRHTAAWRTARNMRELGVMESDAERWVEVGARKCSPPLSASEARKQVRSAFA